jgi:hypothetical protein
MYLPEEEPLTRLSLRNSKQKIRQADPVNLRKNKRHCHVYQWLLKTPEVGILNEHSST